MKTNKRKKVMIIGLIVIAFLIAVYFFYKIGIINYYNIDLKVESSSINVKKEIEISETNYTGDYIASANMKIPNYFSDFVKSQDGTDIIYTKKDDENIKLVLTERKILSPIKQFEQIGIVDKDIGKEVLKENNINQNIELLKYVANYKFSNRTIFTNIDKLLEEEAMYDFAAYYYLDNITIFDGYIDGYYSDYRDNGCKLLYIFNGDNSNLITFCGKAYFTDDYIVDLLSKIKLDWYNYNGLMWTAVL